MCANIVEHEDKPTIFCRVVGKPPNHQGGAEVRTSKVGIAASVPQNACRACCLALV